LQFIDKTGNAPFNQAQINYINYLVYDKKESKQASNKSDERCDIINFLNIIKKEKELSNKQIDELYGWTKSEKRRILQYILKEHKGQVKYNHSKRRYQVVMQEKLL